MAPNEFKSEYIYEPRIIKSSVKIVSIKQDLVERAQKPKKIGKSQFRVSAY